MEKVQEPIPLWAKPILWFNDNVIFGAPGEPVCQVRWAVNFHKVFTLFLIYWMMAVTDNFSTGAWVYLALHGIYGYCWLIKDYAFRDLQFEQKISVLGVVNVYVFLIAWYWLAPWLFLSREVELTAMELGIAVAVHTLGVVIMIAGDGQRHWVMKYNKGLMNFGMYRYTRNPNYLGEIMLYFAYAFMAQHWASWLVFGYMVVYFLARMTAKDHSISRYPGWTDYKKQSGILIPWRILNGRAFVDLFRNQWSPTMSGWQKFFIFAAVFNVVAGLGMIFAPELFYRLLMIDDPIVPEMRLWIDLFAVLVITFGWAYWMAARDLVANRGYILMGIIGKSLVVLVAWYHALLGTGPLNVAILILADLAFALAFLRYYVTSSRVGQRRLSTHARRRDGRGAARE